jgi:hypothetical protein
VALGTSPSSFPQSFRGQFEVIIVDRVLYRRIITSDRHSLERLGNCIIPMSSIISSSGFKYFISILSSCPRASSWRKL